MTYKRTHIQTWALLLILRTARKLGRSPEAYEVVRDHRLGARGLDGKFRFALSGLERKGFISRPPPRPQRRRLRVVAPTVSL